MCCSRIGTPKPKTGAVGFCCFLKPIERPSFETPIADLYYGCLSRSPLGNHLPFPPANPSSSRPNSDSSLSINTIRPPRDPHPSAEPASYHTVARCLVTMSTGPSTAARNTPRNRARKLAVLKSKESCEGKSKFFLEHQVLWEKEGNKGYDTDVHGWRYTNQQLPMPEGEWPDISVFMRISRCALDEHEKEEVAKWHRMENRLLQEEVRQQELIKGELRRQQERLASQQDHFASGRNNLPSRDDEGHVSNVQMALQFFNRKNPDSKYELKEITAKSTIYDFRSAHCHYNFAAYFPTDGFQLFFAEVDVLLEHHVLQCCAIGSGPHGCCMGCQSQGVLLIRPSCDKFFAGQESFCTDCEWC